MASPWAVMVKLQFWITEPTQGGVVAVLREVLRRLRQAGNLILVLLFTAKSEVEDKVTGLDTGANDYLTTPFSTAELMARIRAMTRSQTGGPAGWRGSHGQRDGQTGSSGHKGAVPEAPYESRFSLWS